MAANKFSSPKPPTSDKSKFVSGWKDIANHLSKGVRTVQRYEREMGLPVRRPAGVSYGSVMAWCSELDQWVSAPPTGSAAQVRLELQPVHVVKSGMVELRRLCAQGLQLRAAVEEQSTALPASVQRIIQTLGGPASPKGERHLAIAAKQSVRAAEMIDRVRKMSDQAKEMRKPPNRRLAGCGKMSSAT